MLVQIVWIFTIARTCTCSNSCQSAVEVDVCSLDPDISHDSNSFEGFFYDRHTDKCLSTTLGDHKSDGSVENKFTYAEFCNSRCRKKVPEICFDDATTDYLIRVPKPTVEKWTYDSDSTKCVQFTWTGGDTKGKNIFDSLNECVNKCKVPDLGLCAYEFRTDCKHGDDLYIWYDYKDQACKILNPDHCPTRGNAFYTYRDCYRRCGRTSKHRCVQEPDYSFPGAFQKYYYDITRHKCEGKKLFRGHVSGNSNLFETWEDCKETCMAIYKYEPEWL
uniref:Putative salivary kunitz domain protein n=1 Tax=Ixodes ricinus TaxID=34613 RepID=A0A0K8R2S4_IXORI